MNIGDKVKFTKVTEYNGAYFRVRQVGYIRSFGPGSLVRVEFVVPVCNRLGQWLNPGEARRMFALPKYLLLNNATITEVP